MAKKFNFKLDPVLKIRSFKVKEAKEDLGKTMSKRVKAEMEMESKRDYLNNLMQSKAGKIVASELQTQWNHNAFVEQEISQLGDEREKLLIIEDKKRIILEKAMKNEKVITKLRERRKIDHDDLMQKEETKEMDEIGQNIKRANRNIKK